MEFFGTLSREWALECMKDLLLVNLRGNLQIIVQVNMIVLYYVGGIFFFFVLCGQYYVHDCLVLCGQYWNSKLNEVCLLIYV